nr:MAG TPA_asm: hypothetical protein [Caudoviricetes sp.]
MLALPARMATIRLLTPTGMALRGLLIKKTLIRVEMHHGIPAKS